MVFSGRATATCLQVSHLIIPSAHFHFKLV